MVKRLRTGGKAVNGAVEAHVLALPAAGAELTAAPAPLVAGRASVKVQSPAAWVNCWVGHDFLQEFPHASTTTSSSRQIVPGGSGPPEGTSA